MGSGGRWVPGCCCYDSARSHGPIGVRVQSGGGYLPFETWTQDSVLEFVNSLSGGEVMTAERIKAPVLRLGLQHPLTQDPEGAPGEGVDLETSDFSSPLGSCAL